MTGHDPAQADWVALEITRDGRTRRYDGPAAILAAARPFLLVAFGVGWLFGGLSLLLVAAVIR